MHFSLSDGGYQAMLFLVCALWRLYESGLLQTVKRISSVSGESITAAQLGLKWSLLSFELNQLANDLVSLIVRPIRAFARKSIDVKSGVS